MLDIRRTDSQWSGDSGPREAGGARTGSAIWIPQREGVYSVWDDDNDDKNPCRQDVVRGENGKGLDAPLTKMVARRMRGRL